MKNKLTILVMVAILFTGIAVGHFTNADTVNADTVDTSWQAGYAAGWYASWQDGYSTGWAKCQAKYDMYGANFTGGLTGEQVISLLESYRYNHQYFVDHPEMVGNMTGTVKDNQRLVDNYTKIIQYVEKTSGGD